jgi:Domain of unknown function (DUF5658)
MEGITGAAPRAQRIHLAGRRRSAVALAVALVPLSILDLLITEFGVRHFGAVELNPIMEPLVGTGWAPLVKIGLPVFILLLAPKVRSGFVVAALRGMVALYLVVAVVNMGQLLWALA